MLWFLIASVGFVVAHRAVEGLVCGTGDNARRKFLWNMGTAAFFVLALAGGWVAILLNGAWWQSWGGVLAICTPLALAGIGAFAYLNFLVYTDDERRALSGRQ